MPLTETKICPCCGEEIPAKATKCKFCQEDLGNTGTNIPYNKQENSELHYPDKQKEKPLIPKTVKIIIGLVFVVLVIVLLIVNNANSSSIPHAHTELAKQALKDISIKDIIIGSWEGSFEDSNRKVTYQIDARKDGTASVNINGYIGGEEYAMGKCFIDYDGQMTGAGHWSIANGLCLRKWENHTKKMHIRKSSGEGFKLIERNEHSAARQRDFNSNPTEYYWLFPDFSVSRIDDNTIKLTNLTPEGKVVSYGTSITMNRIPK